MPRRDWGAACAVALALALALGIGGCGGSGPKVPRGDPDLRHGPTAIDSYAQVEFMRALLIASSDEFYAGGPAGDARTQLQRARALYNQLAGRVRTADPTVDREVTARFNLVARLLAQGAPPDRYRDFAGPLSDQLMDGVSQALVPRAAGADPGVKAEALRRIAIRMAADYDAATSALDDTQARLAFEEAWGMWRRGQAVANILGNELGSKQSLVKNTLATIHAKSFPQGPSIPQSPRPDQVDGASVEIVDAVVKRFGLAP